MFMGMQESFGIIVSVVVGFLYRSKGRLSFSFDMVIARKLIVFTFSSRIMKYRVP